MLRGGLSLAVIVFMAVASVAKADNRILLVTGGKYFLIDVTNGSPTIEEVKTVINTGPSTPTEPAPPVGNTTKEKVRVYTVATNDPLIARGIAEGAYLTVRQRLDAGDINWDQSLQLLKAATDLAVSQSDSKDSWSAWRSKIGDLIDELQVSGKLDEKEEQVAFLKDVELGMTSAFPNSAVNLERLLSLVRSMIELIITLMNQLKFVGDGVSAAVPTTHPFAYDARRRGGGFVSGVGDAFSSFMCI